MCCVQEKKTPLLSKLPLSIQKYEGVARKIKIKMSLTYASDISWQETRKAVQQ